MGGVHKEQVNEGRGCHEWDILSLSDLTTVKSLIMYRIEFDANYEMKLYENSNPLVTNGVPLFSETIEVTYLDLERLIEKADLSEIQQKVVDLHMRGYYHKDVADKLNRDIATIKGIFNSACKKIVEQNHKEWLDWIYISGRAKYNDDVRFKQCTKCGEWLEVCDENFYKKSDSPDGFRHVCKKCYNKV